MKTIELVQLAGSLKIPCKEVKGLSQTICLKKILKSTWFLQVATVPDYIANRIESTIHL